MKQRLSRVALLLTVLSAGCALTEITLATPANLVVAEIVLRAGQPTQLALLHRTRGSADSLTVPGARIEVRDSLQRVLSFEEVPVRQCLDDADSTVTGTDVVGSCYRSAGGLIVLPGRHYTLRITLEDGGVMTGETTVPGDFQILRPSISGCRLDADQNFELLWTTAVGTWAYVAETELRGIRAALQPRGIAVKDDPLRLLGVSVGRQDTTMVFPSEFGLFDRADPDLADVLVALQPGLPANVSASTVVAAADRNYVNWVRGGRFNPSGMVQVPSIVGDGTGIFASIVPRNVAMATTDHTTTPACQ